ncbi:P-loop containing nucleoside triphosphate hydrolase protein [Irpex rosettiformis]|uniref:P-loop containing nucleoside triphosphate hydrolase protein n=1 Tax=Irpex rosettiformis TaxID=378272 RepID=A0ACB8UH12_9APHY|nr:P-loop containing nucleoside triphosphate hydrolase protein [Irpex rosettiformis]
MSEPILEVKDVGCSKAPGQPIFEHVNFAVNDKDIIVLQGKSGSGKTTLLKCLAHLNLYEGQILYRGKPPQSYGIPIFRTRVLYVPQRPSLLPGTPRDFLNTISGFSSRSTKSGWFSKSHEHDSEHHGNGVSTTAIDLNGPIEVSKEWGIEEELWDRNWSELSGGEGQRIALATGVGLGNAEILLLDEPTSALDAGSSEMVEKYILNEVKNKGGALKAVVWITHSADQGKRVGDRFLRVTAGGIHEERGLEEA